MIPVYRYKIQVDSDTPRIVYPTYKQDLAVVYEMESGQQFMRRKLSGKLDFTAEDFDYIMQQTFDATYYVIIEASTDYGLNWSEYWRGKFMRTDCTINADDKKITVQPDVVDQYNDVLAGLEKEYNLVELAPEIERVMITKRAALQVYLQGDDTLTYIVNGLSFESSCQAEDNRLALQNAHFSTNGRFRELAMKLNGSLYNIYEGMVPTSFTENYTGNFTTGDGLTYVRLEVVAGGGGLGSISYAIKRTSDDAVLWSYLDAVAPIEDVMSFDMTAVGGSGSMHCDVVDRAVWYRMLCDTLTYNGNQTYELQSNDLSYDNRNYRRCIEFPLAGYYIQNSSTFSSTPTEWGRTNDGLYFTRPVDHGGANFYPIGRSQWIYTSLWIKDDGTIRNHLANGNKQAEIRTNYPLYSVIKVLLAQFSSAVFNGSSAYSQLLYGTTSFGLNATPLLMTPKSNLLAGEFSQPAMKATITLKDVLSMLKNLFQAYWYIGTDNKFHVEHISYFKNGGSYSNSPTVGIDLTAILNSRNGKPWSYHTSEYTFNKEDMPERYQFEWMDDVSEAFIGQPIEVLSKYVKEGKIENINISQFTTDVDYMLLAPEDISKDGFALFACTYSGGVYSMAIGAAGGSQVQNYQLSFVNLQPVYWQYDLPARSVKIQGTTYTITGMMQRNKKQEINVPVGDTDADVLKLVKTDIGNGQIEKMSINLSSRMAKTTLRYDTE